MEDDEVSYRIDDDEERDEGPREVITHALILAFSAFRSA
jgi:hypothetical protein